MKRTALSMSPDEALSNDISRMDVPWLLAALKVVGGIKLAIRRDTYANHKKIETAFDRLKPYNVRVDDINREMEYRLKIEAAESSLTPSQAGKENHVYDSGHFRQPANRGVRRNMPRHSPAVSGAVDRQRYQSRRVGAGIGHVVEV